MSSYVTRRLLRSTLPDAKDTAAKEKVKEESTCQAKLRSNQDDKQKKVRRDSAKEGGERDENERTRGNEDGEPEAPQSVSCEGTAVDDAETVDSSALHGFELLIDVNYAKDLWAEARVLDLNVNKQEVFVHYMGWNARYDAWVASKLIAAHGSRTKSTTKKKTSWDGKRSLFAPIEGSTPRKLEPASKQSSVRRSATPKSKSDKRKRKGSAGSATGGGSRSGSTPTSPTDMHQAEDSAVKDEGDAVADLAPRVTRARASKANKSSSERSEEMAGVQDRGSPSNRSVATKSETNSDAVCEDEEMPLADATPATNEGTGRVLRCRANEKRRGRGRKGQEDESSESEYSNHEDSDAEEEDDASDEEEVRRLRKRRKQKEQGLLVDEEEEKEASDGAAKGKRPVTRRSERRTANTKTHPLPQSVSRASTASIGDGGATRERLAAIFRQRVYQQQLMQVTRAEMQAQQPPSGAAAASVAPTAAATTRPRRGANQNGSKTKTSAPVAAPAAVPDPQLAAYYHYHNMMMAQAYMTVDPKEIQERLRAIEQQRVLQVQAHYRQLEAVRAQNVQSIEDTQEFMSKSANVWQQQSQAAAQLGDEKTANGDSTALKNWNGMAKSLGNEKAAATGSDSPRDASAQELVDATGAVKKDKEVDAGASQSDAALKHELKAPSCEPDAPRGDILYEFVL